MRSNWYRAALVYATVIVFPLHFSTVGATDSDTMGASGGGTSFNLHCPGQQKMYGVQLKYYQPENRVTQIRPRCRGYNSGTWAQGSTTATAWPETAFNTIVVNKYLMPTVNLHCPRNFWVGAIHGTREGNGQATIVKRVTVQCFAANTMGERVGQPVERRFGNGGSSVGVVRECPGTQIADGLAGNITHYLSGARLKCSANGKMYSWLLNKVTREDQNIYRLPDSALGRNLKQIMTRNFSVRDDDNPCIVCHVTNGGLSQSEACTEAGEFLNASKPRNLKSFFNSWLSRNCQT